MTGRNALRLTSLASALERPGSDAPLCGHQPLILKFGVSSKRKQPHESEFQPEPVKLHQSRIAIVVVGSESLREPIRMSIDPQIVTNEGLERELSLVRASAVNSRSIFDPQSAIWCIDREASIFLGAGRALLLQLAHPWVAAAIEQHSHTFANPIGRFHRTFGIVFNMVFGCLEDSLVVARQLHRRHAAITGTLPSAAGPFAAGSAYFANSLPALRWVWATLTDTALIAYRLVLPPPLHHVRNQYYANSRLFAALFGIPQAYLPRDWQSFSAYVEETVQSDTLTVTATARSIAHRLLAGSDLWFPVPRSYKALTAGLLPPVLRDGFGLHYGVAERRRAQQLIRWAQRTYPLLPGRLRYVGPYYEALTRFAGRPTPDYLTQLSNHLWIGRGQLYREPS